MGQYYNPIIPALDNLVYCLDFGNTRSYPGTGNTGQDISTSGFSATTVNSPSFTTTNKGEFNFVKTTGTRIHSHGSYTLSGAKSSFVWMYPSTVNVQNGSYQRVVVWMTTATQSQQFAIMIGNESLASPPQNDPLKFYLYSQYLGQTNDANSCQMTTAGYAISTWYHMGFTYPGSGTTVLLYGNGTYLGSKVAAFAISFPTFTGVLVGGRPDSTNFDYNGKIASVQVFNKQLSDVEVAKLYNATKGRFGL